MQSFKQLLICGDNSRAAGANADDECYSGAQNSVHEFANVIKSAVDINNFSLSSSKFKGNALSLIVHNKSFYTTGNPVGYSLKSQ